MTIKLYTWGTPNGRKASIALEELELSYEVFEINIGKGDQFAADFLKISPNNKIPAILDPDGPGGTPISIFESGAILLYLAQKTGRLMPGEPAAYWKAMEWIMWQMGNVGPYLGQLHHFRRFAKEKIPYAIERYDKEARRLYSVLDQRLDESPYIAGDAYTMADIISYPWAARHGWQEIDLAAYPNVQRWFDELSARPAVKRGMEVPFLN
ncbi:MAG: glutathione S-transferase N-terminal domain-containing protein [Kiloniellales bacterium]|nr:glutathione S-transferase N-terminal domain-containing protein [Kiloniellales bacterium]